MNDLHTAKQNLGNHSLCLCRDGVCRYGDGRGISVLMSLVNSDEGIEGCSAADTIVGKAAAMLFVKGKVAGVYARVLSRAGEKVLREHGISYEYGALTDMIINRAGTGMCPMEQTVSGIDDIEEGCKALRRKLNDLSAQR